MDRLTKRIGEHVYYTKGEHDETIPAECESWDVREILKVLAAYEDTGLTPERCAELAKAEREGRLGIAPPVKSGRGWVPWYGEVKEVIWRTIPFDMPLMSAVDGSFANYHYLPEDIKETREEAEKALESEGSN